MEVDNNKVYTWANQAGLDFFGQDVVGKEAAFYFEGEQDTYSLVQPIFNGIQDVVYIESWQRRQDGEKRLLAWWCRMLKDAHGNVTGALSSARDITEHRQAVQALEESEAQLRAVLDATPFPIALVDVEDNNVDFWSRSALSLFGHTAPTAAEWYEMAYPDPDYRAEVVERWRPALEKAQQTGQAVNAGEYRVACRDGSVRICELYAAFLPERLIVTFNDITERKRADEALQNSEAFLDSIIEHSPHAMWISDATGTLIRLNQACRDLLHITDNEVVGKYNILDDNIVKEQGFLPMVKQVFEQGETVKFTLRYDSAQLEHLALRQTKFLVLDVTISPVLDANGKISNAIIQHIDITERMRAEAEIQTLNAELEQRVAQRTVQLRAANKELESFSYSVSHDLRAPLRAISGFASIVARRHRADLNPEGQHYIDNIVQASARMGRLIDDLLTYSRLGRNGVRRDPVALREMFAALASDFASHLAESGGTLDIADDLPVVTGDKTLLSQIFVNLIENALTYHKPDVPARVRVTCQLQGSNAIIGVSDDGIGIPAEYHEKIFDVFQRLHSEDEYPGTGIGLATVKKSVALLGASVWVESTVGQGSTFYVKLPLSL